MEYYSSYKTSLKDLSFGELKHLFDKDIVNEKIINNNRAIDGDIVYIKDDNVVGIKERNLELISGILHLDNNQKYGFTKRNIPYFKFTSISYKFPNFIVPCKSKLKKKLYCVIKFNKWDTKNRHPIGQIEYLIGPVGDMQNEIDILLYHTKIYPKKNKITYIKTQEELTPEYDTFSIDPPNCKDIDDALHFHKSDNFVEIGIHIANVSRYIDSLKTDFFSTIYLNDKQINMLDDNFTYQVCSLGNGEPKKALSLILKYDNFKLIEYKFKETIVRNKAMSYGEVDEIILKNKNSKILDLYNFTLKIKDLDDIPSTKLVEHYMILYNKLFAETLFKTNPYTIFRSHKIKHIDNIKIDSRLQKYLHNINQESAIYTYNTDDTFHEDLGLKYYTHATSPIRRYIDIINHKNMINYLENNKYYSLDNLDKINLFQKKARKFYNYYKKLNLIFNFPENQIYDAFIIGIQNLKVSIFIPELDIEHSFKIISEKLLEIKHVIMSDDNIAIENIKFSIYDKIKIKLTPLPYEHIFNKKLHVEIINLEDH